jgi:hypothetical protein
MVERDFEPKPDAVFQYGVLRKNNKLRDRCFKQGVDNFLCDNGYFLPGHFDGYYRITKNRFQSDGFGEPKWDRYERLGLEVKPWRKTGDFILITVPPPEYNKYWNFDGDAWVRKIKSKLK